MNAGVTSTVGELEVHVVQPEAGVRPPLLVVFCHGYGASGEDLVPFVPELLERERRLAPVRFAFPAGAAEHGRRRLGRRARLVAAGLDEAVHALPDGGWSRATPQRDAGRPGLPRGESSRAPSRRCSPAPGSGRSGWCSADSARGRCSATDLALHWEHRPAALVALSSVPVTADTWQKLAPRRAGLPVILSHGRQDPVLPYSEGEALRDLLTAARTVGRLHPLRRPPHRPPRRAGPGGPAAREPSPRLMPMPTAFRRFSGTDRYLTNDALEAAVNCALALERPLLVQGRARHRQDAARRGHRRGARAAGSSTGT